MARKTRQEKLAAFEIVDCTTIPVVRLLDCDRLDFEIKMFEERIQRQEMDPYIETVKLIENFKKAAMSAPRGTPAVEFDHKSKEKWRCRVAAYVDRATGLRCLEFSEV